MHYTEPIYRHPMEANSVLIELTTGCSHNKCAFCSFFNGVKFRPAPLEHIEQDFDEVKQFRPQTTRFFGCGGDAFCLPSKRLINIASMMRTRFPQATMGMYARISNMRNKTVNDLRELRRLGINGIYIGVESADDAVLARMNKGYGAAEVLDACQKLEVAGIEYYLIYLGGLAGAGACVQSALTSLEVINQLHPAWLSMSTCTTVPDTPLYDDVLMGRFTPPSELERLQEQIALLRNLKINTRLYGYTRSNSVQFGGEFPQNKAAILGRLERAEARIGQEEEEELARQRRRITRI